MGPQTPSEAMKEPTGKQCDANAIIEHDGVRYMAAWYPQMGGSVGACLVELLPKGNPDDTPGERCFEVYVWHDGEFPFGDRCWDEPGGPARLHHCSADQFIAFGEAVKRAFAGISKRHARTVGG
jgi:hypothetical protein